MKSSAETPQAKRTAVEVRGDQASGGVWLVCSACQSSIPVRRHFTVDYAVRWADAHLCEVPNA